jgi:hypothetical protein
MKRSYLKEGFSGQLASKDAQEDYLEKGLAMYATSFGATGLAIAPDLVGYSGEVSYFSGALLVGVLFYFIGRSARKYI